MGSLPRIEDAAGHAALAICESLLLSLTDLKLMTQQDAHDLLSDAAAAHRQASPGSQSPETRQAVVAILERILAGKNSTKHE
jgi:hypothetical protein